MISISPATYYSGPGVVFKNFIESDLRIKRSIRTDITLDNKVVVTDSGFTWGDSTQKIDIEYNPESYETLLLWLQGWPDILVSRPDGIWSCIMKDVMKRGLKTSITLLVVERINL